ncbi:MAG TPA: hypothetical protein PK544_10920 [Spirochaetota bacterium]|nr:hypothetical protein [Spirochaetota bacterium]
MKKIIPVVVCALFMISCSSSHKGVDSEQPYRVIGFVKQDIFRIEAIGFASGRTENEKIRKQLAKTAAQTMAEFGILEYFAERGEGDTYKNLQAAKNDEGIVKGWLKGGEIISAKYDDDLTCRIVYELKLVPKRR